MATLKAKQTILKAGPYKGGKVTQFFQGKKRVHVYPVHYTQPVFGQKMILIGSMIYNLIWE